MDRKILGAIAAVAALAIGGWFVINNSSGPASTAIAQTTSIDDVDISGVQDFALGAEDAPVTIYEYASFTCPHCKSFHENTFKQLKAEYIDTGKVRFVLREVYFDRYGLWAGMVARCDNGSRYHGLVDLIFENQREWAQGEPAVIAGNLKRLGKLAGMDDETLDACLSDAGKAEALNAFFQVNAKKDNISSTPTFVINGTTHNNMSYQDLKAIIDGELS